MKNEEMWSVRKEGGWMLVADNVIHCIVFGRGEFETTTCFKYHEKQGKELRMPVNQKHVNLL